MALFNLLFMTILFNSEAKLPELMTKQALHNIRLTTRDGKFTYYQRGMESLLLSSNYSVHELLKLPEGTQFEVISTTDRKNIVILAQENFHKLHSVSSPQKVYWSVLGSKTATELTKGNSAQLHLGDSWVSVYSVLDKKINFFNLVNSERNFSIRTTNQINPFFIPHIEMITEDKIIYTDINNDGLMGLLSYDRISKKNKLLYKVDEPYFKIEFCKMDDELILGHFSLDEEKKYSQILKSNFKDFNFNELYLAKSSDIGNIHCARDEKNVYFIKDTTEKKLRKTSDVFSLGINSKNLEQVSKMNDVSQIINMDGMLLLPNKGKYYVLKGNSKLNTLDKLKEQ